MEYFEKYEKNPYKELAWNIPERKKGTANVIGGSSQNFRTVVRTAENLAEEFPLEMVKVVLPQGLESKLPKLANFEFLPATDKGTFSGADLDACLEGADYNLMVGDMSKNKITGKAVTEALTQVKKPVLVTRDTVDLLAEHSPEAVLRNAQVGFLATIQQLQKLLRSIYYPKVMTLSQSLLQIAEVLHKFTLSYEVGIVTFYNGQVLVASKGKVAAVAIEKTEYTPITLWGGQLAGRILALNLYNPSRFLEAGVAAVFGVV